MRKALGHYTGLWRGADHPSTLSKSCAASKGKLSTSPTEKDARVFSWSRALRVICLGMQSQTHVEQGCEGAGGSVQGCGKPHAALYAIIALGMQKLKQPREVLVHSAVRCNLRCCSSMGLHRKPAIPICVQETAKVVQCNAFSDTVAGFYMECLTSPHKLL